MDTQELQFSKDIPPDSVIALGDVHGCYDQFSQFLDWVRDSDARVILLGDLIDRGPNDLGVLERVRDLVYDPESWGLASLTCVRGNHETLFLNALEGYGVQDWVFNGGDWGNWRELSSHAGWLSQLPYYVTVGDTFFSHSGGVHGVAPEESLNSLTNREQFVWSRSASKKGSGLKQWSKTLKKSVFGHSPEGDMPYLVGDAVCIDTWCFDTGTLTAYNATYNTFNQFVLK